MSKWLKALLVPCLAMCACFVALSGEAGKDPKGGFNIKDGEFTLNGEFWVHFLGAYTGREYRVDQMESDMTGLASTDTDSRTDFTIRRTRVAFFGKAFFPWLGYKVEVDYGRGKTAVTDAYIDMAFKDWLNIRAGQFKQQFDMFQMMNDKYPSFADAPMGTAMLSPARDIGLMYSGRTKNRMINWALAFQNGNGPNTTANDNNRFRTTIRFEVQNKGGFRYRPTTSDAPKGVEWTVGLAYQNNPQGGLSGDVSSSGCTFGTDTNCHYSTRSQNAFELFGAVRHRFVQVNATFQKWDFTRDGYDVNGELAKRKMTYWNLDGIFFVHPKWSLMARYGEWKDDDPLDNRTTDTYEYDLGGIQSVRKGHEWRVGMNHFIAGDNLKLIVDYGQQQTKTTDDFGGMTGVKKDTETAFRVMLAFFI